MLIETPNLLKHTIEMSQGTSVGWKPPGLAVVCINYMNAVSLKTYTNILK